jgi:hypothetical protein
LGGGDGGGAWLRLGILVAFGRMRIESAVFSLTVAAGLNNQRVGKSFCSEVQESLPRIFRSRGVIWWMVWIKYSINHFFRVS